MVDRSLVRSFSLSNYCPMVLEILDGLVAKAEAELTSQDPADVHAVQAKHAVAYARQRMLAEFQQIIKIEPEVPEPERPTNEEIILKSIQGV